MNFMNKILPFRVLILEDKSNNDYIYGLFKHDEDLNSIGYDNYPIFHINNLLDSKLDDVYKQIDFSKYYLLVLDYGGLGDLGWGNNFTFMRRAEHFIKKKLLNKFKHIFVISAMPYFFEDDEYADFLKDQGVIFIKNDTELKERILEIYEKYKDDVRRELEKQVNHKGTDPAGITRFRLADLEFYKDKIEYSVEVLHGSFNEEVINLCFFEIDKDGNEKQIV